MPLAMQIALGLLVCAVSLPVSGEQKRPAVRKASVELRWVENKRIAGLTEKKGFQSSCDPKSIVYPHKEPALVLTAAEVSEVGLRRHDLSLSGLPNKLYMVTIVLTKDARDKLAAACGEKSSRVLTVLVDKKYWGLRSYVRDRNKPFVPKAARAASFTVQVGFFSSKAEAQRLVNAFTPGEDG